MTSINTGRTIVIGLESLIEDSLKQAESSLFVWALKNYIKPKDIIYLVHASKSPQISQPGNIYY